MFDVRLIAIRFIGLVFLRHVNAKHLLDNFLKTTEKLDLARNYQVSIDVHNIVFFIEKLSDHLTEECDSKFINIGSCRLHTQRHIQEWMYEFIFANRNVLESSP